MRGKLLKFGVLVSAWLMSLAAATAVVAASPANVSSQISKAPAVGRHYIKVAPRTVKAGKVVRIYGAVKGCGAGSQVTLYSFALKGATPDEFAGVPAVTTNVRSNETFSIRVRLAKTVSPGSYHVGGRCGGGNFGSTTLRVRHS